MLSAEAMALSKDVPLMIGTTKNEFAPFFLGPVAQGSEAEVMAFIKNQHGDRADEFIAAVKEAYPGTTNPQDLINIDPIFRPGAVNQANLKSSLADGAPVYMYLFTWPSPVMDGKYRAIHCMDIPFAFNTVERARNMTGGGPETHALAEKVSQAYINFARSGNPNHSGLPQWEAYTEDKGATMMLDVECGVRHHPDQKLLDFNNRR